MEKKQRIEVWIENKFKEQVDALYPWNDITINEREYWELKTNQRGCR